MRHQDDILARASELKRDHDTSANSRTKVRAILNGGLPAIQALLGSHVTDDNLPWPNLMLSGLTRLAQKIGNRPDVRVDPPNDSDNELPRKRAERRERIVEAYDLADRLELQLPQVGRWLPGYGFAVWTIGARLSPEGLAYPHAELRDPYDCYPSAWGVDQQPDELAIWRRITPTEAKRLYPEYASMIDTRTNSRSSGGVVLGGQGRWANTAGRGLQIVEFYDADGLHILLPDIQKRVAFTANPLESGPSFVVVKRFAFDQLAGQYDHTMGLMAAQAKLNVLEIIATTDGVMTEALALDTPLPTPRGWTTMGEVEKGDLLFGVDGLPVEVTSATEIQHDRASYRVTFEDGTSVVASDGHLWTVKVAGQSRPAKVRTTQEMVDDGRRFRVPASKPWKLPEADLPIDPYMLGLWLGDGTSTNAVITAGDRDVIEVERNIGQAGYTTKRVSTRPDRAEMVYVSEPGARKGLKGSGLHGKLRMNGLMGNKHVPKIYLRGSIDQRTALLQGLMDSDGTIGRVGGCRFSNSNERIIDGIMELLRSLGEIPVKKWIADERSRSGGYWLVTFTSRHVMPFRLERKADRVRWHNRGPKWVTIRSIEPIADSVPVRCIAVASNDGLFLAGPGAHTTHNTNIFGEIVGGGQYQKGRHKTNFFTPGSSVEKPSSNLPYQTFEQNNRLERQFRLVAGYPIQDDAQSPVSFATGKGLEELSTSTSNEVSEYHKVLKFGLQDIDAKRLEWDDKVSPETVKPLVGVRGGVPFVEKYRPRTHINGDYRTRRAYGAMASLDDTTGIVASLQLLGAEAIDVLTVQENIRGLDNLTKINERIADKKASDTLREILVANAQNGDPRAIQVFIEQMPEGDEKQSLKKFFTSDEPQMSEEEEAFLNGPQGLEALGGGGGLPPDLTTVMSRLQQGGGTQGGAQSVARL